MKHDCKFELLVISENFSKYGVSGYSYTIKVKELWE